MNIKENKNIKIKVASPENAAELLDIYKFYVENTAISFEIETPTLQEFRARIEKTLKKYPYLIAVSLEDEILGYAYASELKSRAAYDWSIETSIYVKKEYRKMGILLMDVTSYFWIVMLVLPIQNEKMNFLQKPVLSSTKK